MTFFTSPGDLRDWFLRVEAAHPLHYVRGGPFGYPATPIYASISAIPNLASPRARYYLLPPGEHPGRWQPSTGKSGSWHYVDRQAEENIRWPVLTPSFLMGPLTLDEGEVWLDDDRPGHRSLREVIEGEGQQALHVVKGHLVGPEALSWLMAGTVRFREEDARGEPLETPRDFHPCRVGKALFRTKKILPAWRTTDVQRLLGQVADAHDVRVLPVLADALEDAGCRDADLLGHCRWPGEHVRGCWLLGRLAAE